MLDLLTLLHRVRRTKVKSRFKKYDEQAQSISKENVCLVYSKSLL